jgi:hypothetical protein
VNNGKRRRAARDAAHVPGNKPPTNYIGPNRAARRAPLTAKPKPLRGPTDREKQYARAAHRKARAEARA